jgi:predicted transcriptional regulator of viral defense system
MAIKDYLNTHHVFNMQDFREAFPESVTNLNLLSRAVKNGKVDRVRSGLFVSKSERFYDVKPSAFTIASKAVSDAVFCCMSALQLHGILHNMVNTTQFYTHHRLSRFSYDNQVFAPLLNTNKHIESRRLMSQALGSYLVTTKEQTIVDCLSRLDLAGGPENLLRSLAAVSYLDAHKAIELASKTNKSTCARLGWVMETKRDSWGINESSLTSLKDHLGSGPYYFYPTASSKDGYWSNNWSIYLPCPEQEMVRWLNS